MARGIFGLDRVYKKQVQNIKDDNFESWPESATYGYFAGGFVNPGGQVNTVDRLDLFTEDLEHCVEERPRWMNHTRPS